MFQAHNFHACQWRDGIVLVILALLGLSDLPAKLARLSGHLTVHMWSRSWFFHNNACAVRKAIILEGFVTFKGGPINIKLMSAD